MSAGKRQLVEVVAALRSDLEAAIAEGVGKSVKFDLGEIEVELKASITEGDESKGGGKISFNIAGFFGAETGGDKVDKKSEEYAHTIKLKLLPKVKDSKTGEYVPPRNISGRD